ncbi:DUF885 domain-containing protein [Chitinophaga sp. Mgbs1]|uniref:DUF885 domain-containing protein n=1 Tax=Chitinophaga solisilvae TaxID=1233460 RepID=A0A3S1AYZ4_9BACT|nr:DUF885 domain-containing protein [Chitinophaga solisilvae]
MKAIKKALRRTVLLAGILTTASAGAQQRNAQLNRLFDRYYQERSALFPLEATSAGDHRYDDQLANEGAAPQLAATSAFYQRYLNALKKFDRQQLTEADRISYDILQHILHTGQEAITLHLEYMPMNQFVSTPLELAQLGAGGGAQPFGTVRDYRNWAMRMRAFSPWADTAIANFNRGIKAGVVLPKALVLKMIPQLEALAVTDSARNIFYKPLSHIPAAFSAAEKQQIGALYHEVISTGMIPAYGKLAAYLKNTYLPAAQDQAGLHALPGGDSIYQYYIRVFTTTPGLTGESVYRKGQEEVARITGEMETVKNELGFKGTLQEFFHHLRTNPKLMPFTTPEEVLAAYRRIYEKITPVLGKYFTHLPQTKFEIRRMPAYLEGAMGGPYYVKGNAAENRPGIFYVPVPDARKINVTFHGMEATFIHEGVPGHHFQISFQQENQHIPAFRKQPAFSAYFEGWALYTESLGQLLNCYTDPYQRMGRLNNEMLRATRLVADAGIHTGKMTREEAIAYMIAHQSITEAIATAEIERYMAMPGQALSYKTGEIKIRELRDKYAAQLGSRFNLQHFHDALLAYGDMPLDVLETYMDGWAGQQ